MNYSTAAKVLELHAKEAALNPWNIIGTKALAEELPPIPWLCEAIRLAPGAVALVAGYGYSRKTMAMQSLALSVATGKRLWGLYDVRRGRVVHLDYEQGKRLDMERYQRLARGMGFELGDLDDDVLRVACMPRVYLETQAAIDSLMPVVEGAALVVVDSLRAAFPHADENSSEIRSYLDALNHVSERTGAVVVVIHHARKPSATAGGTATHAIRGSSALFDACQSVYVFEGEKDTPTTVHHQKDRVMGSTVPDFGITGEDVQGPSGSRWGLRVTHLELQQVEAENERKTAQRTSAARERATEKIRAFFVERDLEFGGSRRRAFDIVGGNEKTWSSAWLAMEEAGVLVNDGTFQKQSWRLVKP